MEIIRKAIEARMLESGRIPAGAHVSIESVEGEPFSAYRRVEVLVTKKRCRKPTWAWNLCVDIERGLIHWDTSTHYTL